LQVLKRSKKVNIFISLIKIIASATMPQGVSMIYFNCFRLLPVLTKVCRLSTGAFSHLKAYIIIKYYIELAMFHYFVYVSRATSF